MFVIKVYSKRYFMLILNHSQFKFVSCHLSFPSEIMKIMKLTMCVCVFPKMRAGH